MSLKDNLSKFADKAKDVVEKSGDKIASGVDKATDIVDKKTGGKHHDKLEKLDNLAAKLDKKAGATADDAADAVTDTAAPSPAAPSTDTPPEFPTPQA